jgi:hypothetical protein
VCQEDRYLKELVRYIHLNPLRANIVSDMVQLKSYPYCGHGALLGKKKRSCQDCKYILSFFGRNKREGRKEYLSYMLDGIGMGRRPELVGGGLIRSLGGWDEVKKLRIKGQGRIKGDVRILGESDFVNEILLDAEQSFDRKYEMKSKGYNIEKIMERVASLYNVKPSFIMERGRKKDKVAARDLFCYWTVYELGESLSDVARLLGMSVAGVSKAVGRGQEQAQKRGYSLSTH